MKILDFRLHFRTCVGDEKTLDGHIAVTQPLKIGDKTEQVPMLAVQYRVGINNYRGITNKLKLKVTLYDVKGEVIQSDIWEYKDMGCIGLKEGFRKMQRMTAWAIIERA
ncbi:Uncharacterised protein [uncultured archaeon]|nr:Uncharacterised protein [uncultured archaeon]